MNKTSSLTDQMKIVKKWWNEMDDNKGRIELPINTVAFFMTKKGITPDREKAKNVIYKAQLGRDKRQIVTIDEFNRIFCKGIFKDALVNVVESIDKDKHSENDNLPLSIRISQYQRGLMIDGLMKEKPRHEDGKAILEALDALKREEDPNYKVDEQLLRAFLRDPYERQLQEREAALRFNKINPFVRKFDDGFVNAIRIIDAPTQYEITRSHFPNWRNTGIDDEVNRTFYDEKQEYLCKLKEEQDRIDNKRSDHYARDVRRPAFLGVADKIVSSLRTERPFRPSKPIKNDINPEISLPATYFSADRQTRLGEQSDLLARFQSVVMTKPEIKNPLT
jgi:hypothetical protein